ncbi:helix-turn-helix transcriptional regulator [Pseudoteredinibacter isoporae]|uniref:AraC-like DNA-binding protein n=1 Tax=Pseudoteredinibacter isoporae TaxID=570281 RepID=A0A7X0MWA1_9GAMM|nr:AraC family transcriptional regulator [Pseudoteredinibacter isoporae]MBB6520714.1 AraC-like DNA-binding protein [Pseudoteredinibacter isoporae]NHO86281.1 helix-turn-helix transcriptional regulator [Pseudoteredinibacter isoporae]NIB25268.1 helix-turn-helix transcriptional regulator [Pseudoteredinibacter isoporae]
MELPDTHSSPVLAIGAPDLMAFYRRQQTGEEALFGVHHYDDSEFRQCIQGQYWLHAYHDIGLIGIRDFSITKDFISHSQLDNMLSLEYVLSGGSDMELNQKALLGDGVPRSYLASYDIGGRQTRRHKSGETIKGLGLWLNSEKLIERFQPKFENFPTPVQELLQLKDERVFSLNLSRSIKEVLEEILAMPYEHHMAGIYLEAKVTELLFHTFNDFYRLHQGLDNSIQISHHKAKALAFILQNINNNLATQPDIDRLARETGLSRSNLLSTFKSSVGMNFSDYLLQQRMESARCLITAGKSNILETALAVGYKDQSAFGRAYKRYFGHSPRDDRP